MNRTELLKIAKPILFNTDMVKAILDGRKTVTRRVVKTKAVNLYRSVGGLSGYFKDKPLGDQANLIKPTYCKGDILYVRETWHKMYRKDDYIYRADNPKLPFGGVTWRPSIHMPKSAARIFLKVTGVRVERLQDITVEQIDAEGCKEYGYNAKTGKLMPSRPTWFKIIWDNAIKKQDLDKYSWEANPWVWVYEFERMEHDG